MPVSISKVGFGSVKALYKNKSVLTIGLVYSLALVLLALAISLSVKSQLLQLRTISRSTAPGDFAAFIQSVPLIVSTFSPVIGILLVGQILLFLISVFARGAVMSATYAGQKSSLLGAVSQAASRYLPLIGTYIAASILTGLGLVLLVIPGIYIGTKLSIAPVETAVGGKGITESLKSSWEKTGGNWWDIFFSLIFVGIIILVLSLISAVFALVSTLIMTFAVSFLKVAVTTAKTEIYREISPAPAARRGRKRK